MASALDRVRIEVDIEHFLDREVFYSIHVAELLQAACGIRQEHKGFEHAIKRAEHHLTTHLGWYRASDGTFNQPVGPFPSRPYLAAVKRVEAHLAERRSPIREDSIDALLRGLELPTRWRAVVMRLLASGNWQRRCYRFNSGVMVTLYEPPLKRCQAQPTIASRGRTTSEAKARKANTVSNIPVRAGRGRKGGDGRGIGIR